MASQAAAASSTDKSSKSPPIKTRSEKHERLVHLLRESLSKKISERFGGKERENAAREEEGEGGESVSPTSTISSSGEREGVYTLYTDSLDSGDESGKSHVTVM